MSVSAKKKWGHNFAAFFKLSWKDKLLLIEAILFLGLARVLLLALPFNKIIRLLTTRKTASPKPGNLRRVFRIGTLIRVLSPHMPWRCKCIEQAIAGNLMLRIRNIHSNLHLGLDKKDTGLDAHAWLSCGESIITGHHESGKYTEIYRLDNPDNSEIS